MHICLVWVVLKFNLQEVSLQNFGLSVRTCKPHAHTQAHAHIHIQTETGSSEKS